jgi:chromosome segregation protein
MKLKKLILSGFKSFADRTEFEFDDGVSCIVGPNGCGKSNIVDAIRWVLGERSAKSLRGEEMQDVIFNGSAKRKAAGMAQVTLVFDNGRGLLRPNLPGGEQINGTVSVSRRLYRSGESGYLINKIPCRLRDIREMFMDTGVGVEAYSLIEQGRVEVFLQASQDERRSVFDEAAGISKYKARKAEAVRRLERVEQNLLRLKDILGEVEKRLRSIKYQAGRARSYRKYNERLRELRSLYFLAQHHLLTRQRRDLQRSVDERGDALAATNAMIDRLEAARSATEVEAVDLERAGRELDTRIAAVGGRILTAQQRAEMFTGRVRELGEQIVAASSRCEGLEAKVAAADEEMAARREELGELESRSKALWEQYASARESHAEEQQRLSGLQGSLEEAKAASIELLRRVAELNNRASAARVQREGLRAQELRLEGRAEEIAAALAEALTDKSQADARLAEVRGRIDAAQARLEDARNAAAEARTGEQQLAGEVADARERRSALDSRVQALREMLARHEGIGAGTRGVLQARRAGRLHALRGMLGDFLQADAQHAAMVEAALAGAEELLLADRYADVAAAREELIEAMGDGGVEVVCLDRLRHRAEPGAPACPQALGRVIDYVRYPADLGACVQMLLGRTLVVATLADAVAASASMPPGWRFVTRAGEVLEPDGRVRLGSGGRSGGVISRRSELAALGRERESLVARLDELTRRQAEARGRIDRLDEHQQQLRTAIYEANTERVEAEGLIRRLDARLADLRAEEPLVADELRRVGEELESAACAERSAQAEAARVEAAGAERQREVERLDEEITSSRERLEALGGRLTELRVSRTSVEEKSSAVREALEAAAGRQAQMMEDVRAGREEIGRHRHRRAEAEEGIRQARAEVDELYAEQERLNREGEEAAETRKGLQEKLEQIRGELAERRKAQEEAGEQLNAARVALGEVDVRVEQLITRAEDDMGLKLLDLYGGYEHDDARDWDAVKAEIQDLNEKIRRLGNVNLDAISEQEELEERQKFLAAQLADIEASGRQLNDLIRRINKESRERFVETFEAVRGNFQELFRKLFGGGRADILLIDPEDVLESGIEIVARPPGKELRSLSLLSGGEKTMTALALLFSIFKTHPSPFCVLDEVDAALDETNTERFGKLVRQFVSASQFVIISHAKRTMSMANVLYGVTMQAPGVSSRISVRFEDVGHKLDRQLQPVGA